MDNLVLREFSPGDLGLIDTLADDQEVQYYDGDSIAGGWGSSELSKQVLVPELIDGTGAYPLGLVVCRLLSERPRIYSVGIDLLAGYRGLGLGRLVMRQLLHRLFRREQADRVELLVRDYNQRAIRCYRSVGFREEGHRRRCGIAECQVYGELLMGMLRTEYAPLSEE